MHQAPQMNERDVAIFLAMALRTGLTTPNSVVMWADTLIASEDEPPYWAIEIAAPPRPKDELIKLLMEVPGEANSNTASYLFLALLRRKWLSGVITGPRIGRLLYALLLEGFLPDSCKNWVYSIDDGYDLVAEGHCTQESVDEDLTVFLRPYQAYEHTVSDIALKLLK